MKEKFIDKQTASLIVAALVAGFLGLTVHVLMLNAINPIISKTMINAHIVKPPYNAFITIAAYFTFIFPALGTGIMYYLLGDNLPGQSRLVKGILMGLLLLTIKEALLRQTIMNILVGNPIWVALLQQSQVWCSNLVLTVTLAFMIKPMPKIV